MATAEFHGPMRIINKGENVWGGKVTISTGDALPTDFSGLSTRVFRTTAAVLFAPNNARAALMADNTVTQTFLQFSIPSDGTLRVTHKAETVSDAIFSFIVVDGGTALT